MYTNIFNSNYIDVVIKQICIYVSTKFSTSWVQLRILCIWFYILIKIT